MMQQRLPDKSLTNSSFFTGSGFTLSVLRYLISIRLEVETLLRPLAKRFHVHGNTGKVVHDCI